MRIRKDNDDISEHDILVMAKCSDALAHPARIRMFRYIMIRNRNRENVCNKDLVNEFEYAQATVSQHIGKLTRAGLVTVKKEDKYSYYYANVGRLMQYLDVTKKFELAL